MGVLFLKIKKNNILYLYSYAEFVLTAYYRVIQTYKSVCADMYCWSSLLSIDEKDLVSGEFGLIIRSPS